MPTERLEHGVIGEVVNTADCDPAMRGFESHMTPFRDYQYLM